MKKIRICCIGKVLIHFILKLFIWRWSIFQFLFWKLIWHIFESKIFVISVWQVTHIRLSFSKVHYESILKNNSYILQKIIYEFIYITKTFIATWIIKILIMLMLNMALYFRLIYNPKMWQCVAIQVIPLIVLSFDSKAILIFFSCMNFKRRMKRKQRKGHFICETC